MQGQEPENAVKYLRVKVVDHAKEGRPAVNIKVPIGVGKWGMRMAQAFSPHMKDVNFDWNSIEAMVQEGAQERSWKWKTRPDTRLLRSGWSDGHSLLSGPGLEADW